MINFRLCAQDGGTSIYRCEPETFLALQDSKMAMQEIETSRNLIKTV